MLQHLYTINRITMIYSVYRILFFYTEFRILTKYAVKRIVMHERLASWIRFSEHQKYSEQL